MTYTNHGHHITGTVVTTMITAVAGCGGPGVCGPCSREVESYKPYPEGGRLSWNRETHDFHTPQGELGCGFCNNEKWKVPAIETVEIELASESEWRFGFPEKYQAKATRLVKNHIDKGFVGYSEKPAYEIYAIWFHETLLSWKALISTTLPDSMYYEVTYVGDERKAYLHAYVKTDSIVVSD